MIPGSNLLNTAFELICTEQFQLFRFTGSATNAIGLDVHTYSAPVDLRGSIQAVERTFYTDLGLDWSKRHIQVWTEADVNNVYRVMAGDHIAWNGERWQILTETDWHTVDGWNSFIAVQVPQP